MARNYSNAKAPLLGSAYDSGDSITGQRDQSAKTIAKNTSPTAPYNVYSTVASGIAGQGREAGTAFMVGSDIVAFYALTGSATASRVL